MSAAPAVREQQVGAVLSLLTRLSPRASLAAGAVALVATVAAYTWLANSGRDTEGLLILALPVIGTLFSQAGLNHVTAQQNAVLADQPSTDDVRVIIGEVLREELPVVVAAVLAAREHPAIPSPRAEARHTAELELEAVS